MGDIRFCCRVCGQKLAIDSVAAGWEIRCPKCGTSQTAPAPAPEPGTASKPSASSTEPQPAIPEFASRAPSGGEEFEYEAFISYRHVEPDRTLAKWLHTALETYRVPKKLVLERGLPPRLKKLFRDEDELPASADLSKEIESALRKSRFLIVVCSPQTPASQWVNAEVAFFRALGRNDQILALLIEGEPGESFPQALREIRRTVVEQTGTSRETIENVEPLAADVRAGRKEGQRQVRQMAKLRILASILGIPFDDLRQRERARERAEKIRMCMLMAFGIICLAAGTLAYQQQHRLLAVAQKTANENFGVNDAVLRLQAAQKALANLPPAFIGTQAEWAAVSDKSQNRIVDQRKKITDGLPTYTVTQVLEMIRQPGNTFGAGAQNQQNSGVQPSRTTNAPPTPPAKFLLQGWLVAVRHMAYNNYDKTLVFIGAADSSNPGPWNFERWIESSGRSYSGGASPLDNYVPSLVCVIFEGQTIAKNMADYHAKQEVFVAVQRHPWGAQDPMARLLKPFRMSRYDRPIGASDPYWREFCRFSVPSADSKVLWSCAGEGIEKLDEPTTWIDPILGRGEEIVDKTALHQPFSVIRRDPQKYLGTHGLIEAQFDGLVSRSLLENPEATADIRPTGSDPVVVRLTVSDSIDGSITMLALLGNKTVANEFFDYTYGDTIWLDATVVGVMNLPSFTSPIRSNSPDRLNPSSRGASPPSSSDSGYWVGQIRKKTDQLSELLPLFPVVNSLVINCAWVQIKDKPETMVFANGPRRQGIGGQIGNPQTSGTTNQNVTPKPAVTKPKGTGP